MLHEDTGGGAFMHRKFKSSCLNMRYSNGAAKGQFELRGGAGVGDINLGVICIYMVFKVMDRSIH